MKMQIGWYNPGEHRFCYLDVKENSSSYRRYTVPVYADNESESWYELVLRSLNNQRVLMEAVGQIEGVDSLSNESLRDACAETTTLCAFASVKDRAQKSELEILESVHGTLKNELEILKSELEILRSKHETLKNECAVLRSERK